MGIGRLCDEGEQPSPLEVEKPWVYRRRTEPRESMMYEQHFGFRERPFSIAPNPSYLFMTEQHHEALAHLLYGLDGEGGVILLTGEVGTGKTTICRAFLSHVPDEVDVAFIYNPKLSAVELLDSICEELRIKPAHGKLKTIKDYISLINNRLLRAHASGRKTILIIDEAQNLAEDVLEQLRLLTNLETEHRKLLQIILLGQPELIDIFKRPSMRQFSQRVTARFHLNHLSKKDIKHYVQHRLHVADCFNAGSVFTDKAIAELNMATGGIPRLINVVCDRALLGAYVKGVHRITAPMIRRAAEEVMGRENLRSPLYKMVWRPGFAAGIALLGFVAAAIGISVFRIEPANVQPVEAQRIVSSGTVASPVLSFEGFSTPLNAFQDLKDLWGIKKTGDCRPIMTEEFACYRGRGNLAALRAINRPVVIGLTLESGVQFATLRSINTRHAVLQANGRLTTVTLKWLSDRFDGNYSVIFRTPPQYAGTMSIGMIGGSVRWLSDQMATLNRTYQPSEDSASYFDETLMREVQAFQQRFGLPVSGEVDELTLIHLNNVLDRPGPTLTERPNLS